ncbi:restriction endonuclease subunit S [Stutzerimonas balearica]|uniref:restriction endonuclease subunit S n=1 Tax=Stutzerimonas balearica TaxID=74829 RepID=UPI00190D533E|nr:restriction endonuclease subunit S [Stutzerimonas balearica]
MGALNDWREVRLEDVCERITVGHVGSMANEYVSEGIPFLRSQNITPFKVDLRDVKYITSEFNEKLKKSALKPGDVAVVRTGYPGTAAVIPRALMVSNCSDLVIIRPGEEIDSWFLSCLFNSVWGKSMVAGNLVGVAQQHFNVGAAKNLRIRLPPIQIQQTIASILRNYDDLIENNTRRIEILEEMARRLYAEWFVQFRFPGHEEKQLAFEQLNIFDIFSVRYGKGLSKKELINGGEFPVYGAAKVIGHYHSYTYADRQIIAGCRGSVGEFRITEPKSFVTNNSFVFLPRASVDFFWGYQALKMRGLKDVIGGAAQPQITLDALQSISIPYPSNELREAYSDSVSPLFSMVWNLERKNKNLRTQRDLLLPKLISGEIDVSDIPMPT